MSINYIIRYTDKDSKLHNISVGINEKINEVISKQGIKLSFDTPNAKGVINAEVHDEITIDNINIININAKEKIRKTYKEELNNLITEYNSKILSMSELIEKIIHSLNRYTLHTKYICHYIIHSSNNKASIYMVVDAYSNERYDHNIYSNINQNLIRGVFASYKIHNYEDISNIANMSCCLWGDIISKISSTIEIKKDDRKECALHIIIKDIMINSSFDYQALKCFSSVDIINNLLQFQSIKSKQTFSLHTQLSGIKKTIFHLDAGEKLNLINIYAQSNILNSYSGNWTLYFKYIKSSIYNQATIEISRNVIMWFNSGFIKLNIGPIFDIGYGAGNNVKIYFLANSSILKSLLPTPLNLVGIYFRSDIEMLLNKPLYKLNTIIGFGRNTHKNLHLIDLSPGFEYFLHTDIIFKQTFKILSSQLNIKIPKITIDLYKSSYNYFTVPKNLNYTAQCFYISIQMHFNKLKASIDQNNIYNKFQNNSTSESHTAAFISFAIAKINKIQSNIWIGCGITINKNGNTMIGFNLSCNKN